MPSRDLRVNLRVRLGDDRIVHDQRTEDSCRQTRFHFQGQVPVRLEVHKVENRHDGLPDAQVRQQRVWRARTLAKEIIDPVIAVGRSPQLAQPQVDGLGICCGINGACSERERGCWFALQTWRGLQPGVSPPSPREFLRRLYTVPHASHCLALLMPLARDWTHTAGLQRLSFRGFRRAPASVLPILPALRAAGLFQLTSPPKPRSPAGQSHASQLRACRSAP